MKGKIIFDTARKYVSKARKAVSKNSPTILIVAGGVGVVAGVILAAKAGKESDEKTLEAKKELDYVHTHKELIRQELKEEYEDGTVVMHCMTQADYAKELTHAYGRLIFAYAKIYGPAALTTLFSLFLIFTSHRVLKGRYTTACIGLATMSKAYDAYRKNVIEAEGPEADQRYRFGIKTIEEMKPLLDKEGNPKLDKDGNPKKIKEKHDILPDEIIDPRSVLWDETTAHGTYDNTSSDDYIRWKNNVSSVLMAQEASNNIMRARSLDPRNDGIGYIYLNEVLLKLGMKPIDIGQLVGWRYDPRLDMTNPKYDPYYTAPEDWGDNKVNFGIDEPDLPGYQQRQDFIAGHEDAILLYMNYDGIINDKIGIKSIYSHRR